MIEEIVRNYLLSVLKDNWTDENGDGITDENSEQIELTIPVYTDVPADPPKRYVVIERTGGGMREHIRDAQIVVDSYGESRYRAATLHEQVLAKLPDIATGDVVSACEVNSEYSNTDTETKRYRYSAYFNITYY